MKNVIFLFILTYTTIIYGQKFKDSISNQLYQEIQQFEFIPHKYIGCYGHLSSEYQKIANFKTLIGEDKFISLINDNHYSLKYWAFVSLLEKNDSLAFNYLRQQINNDTILLIQEAGNDFAKEKKFNQLLLNWYYFVIKQKYKEGEFAMTKSVIIVSHKKDLKKWRNLKQNLHKLIKNSEQRNLLKI